MSEDGMTMMATALCLASLLLSAIMCYNDKQFYAFILYGPVVIPIIFEGRKTIVTADPRDLQPLDNISLLY